MAIFNFPPAPVLGQVYTGPNGVAYTWDGEKWVGCATSFNPNDYLEKAPIAGNEQIIIPGQVTDTALRLRGIPGQAANIFEIEDGFGNPVTVFDEQGRLGINTINPQYDFDLSGSMAISGGIAANGTFGTLGQVLYTDGAKVYWGDPAGGNTLDSILKNGNVSNESATVGGLTVQGDLVVTGTQTIVNTEVIKLADNIITLNSNYTGTTPNENAGIEVNRGSLTTKQLYWDETLDRWTVGTDVFEAGTFRGNLLGNVTGTVSSLANHTTDGLAEGTTNLYFTQPRVRNSLAALGDIAYDPATGVFSYYESVHSVNGQTGHVQLTTDDIPEGIINKYGFSPNTALTWLRTRSIGDLDNVNIDGVTQGDILYWDQTAGEFKTIPGDFQDDFITSLAFDSNTGDLVAGRSDNTSFTTSMDGRYLELTGGTLTGPVFGPTAQFGNVNVLDNLTAANTVLGETQVTGDLQVDQDLRVWGTLSANTTDIVISQLSDVQDTNAADEQILVWNSTTVQWEPRFPKYPTGYVFDQANGVVTVTNRDGSTYTVDLDGRYLELANGGQVDGPTLFTAGLQSNVAPVSGDDVTNKSYVDALVANAEVTISAFSLLSGNLSITETNGNVHSVDLFGGLDARYVNADGDVITGDMQFDGNVNIDGTLSANNIAFNLTDLADVNALTPANGEVLTWDSTSGTWIAASADTYVANVSFDSTTGNLTTTMNDGTTIASNFDGRYLELTNGGQVDGLTLFTNGLQSNVAPINADDVTNKSYVDALVANAEVYTANATFDGTTGILTQNRNDGTSYTVSLDGRYVQTVNGVVPDANGNIALNITGASTGDTANFPPSPANGDIYIISGDANANNNGETYIWAGSSWERVVSFDQAESDIRYINASGDTMLGDLTLAGDPTANLHATTKQYVDALVANAEVYTANAAFDITTGDLLQTRNDTTFYTVNLDGRYVLTPAGATNGQVLTWDGTNWTAANVAATLADLTDVDAAGVSNGDILYWDATTSTWKTIAGDFIDNFVTGGTLNANGQLDVTRNDGNTISIDMNGVWLSMTNGGTVTGNTIFNGNLQTPTAPTNNNDVTNKSYVDALVANAEVEVTNLTLDATGNLVITESNGNTHWVNLDGRYVVDPGGATNGQVLTWDGTNWVADNVSTTDTTLTSIVFGADGNLVITDTAGNTVAIDLDGRYLELANGGTVAGNTIFNGNLQTPTAPTSNTDVTNKLYVDNAIAAGELYTNTASFNTNDGILTQTRNDGSTYTVDLDGRYAQTVNGIAPDSNGNVAIALTEVQVGTLAGRPASANNGVIYVVSGDPNANNDGKSFIYDDGTSSWYQIATADLAANDARYVNVSGDTMTGLLELSADPTANLHAATKQYVDNAIAAGELYTNTAAFDNTTGVITQTRNDGSTYTVDINGRFIVEPTATTNGEVLTWNGTSWVAQTLPSGTADTYAASATVAANGLVTFTRNDATTFTTDLSGVWLSLADGGTVAGNTVFNGTLETPTAPTSNNSVANKLYVDTLVGNSVVEVSGFALDATGNLVITETNGDTHWVNLDGRYIVEPTGATNGQVLTWDGTNWTAANVSTTDTTLTSITFGADGNLVITDTAGNTVAVDLDGRYLELTNGGTVAGNTVFNGNLQTPTAPTVNNDVTNKAYVDALVANSVVEVADVTLAANGDLTITETAGAANTTHTVNLFGGLDARYVNAAGDTITGDLIVNGNTQVDGTLIANSTTLELTDLADTTITAPTDGQILSWDSASNVWINKTLPSGTADTFVSGVAIDANNLMTFTRSDGNTDVTIDLDGIWLSLADGGTVAGNTIFNGNLQTPTAPTNNNDVTNKAYVDALVANAEVEVTNFALDATGNLVITESNGNTHWVNLDGRYVVDPGGATNGQVLSWNGTSWVADNVSTTDTTVNGFAINGANLTITETNGNSHTVDIFAGLDARYVNAAGDTITGDLIVNGNTTISGTLDVHNTTLLLGELADANVATATAGQYLSWNGTEWVAVTLPSGTADTFVSGVAIDTNNLMTFTRSDGNTDVTIDLDGIWLSLANGGTVTGNTIFNGNLQTPTAPTVNNDVTNKAYVDALIANSEVYTANAAFNVNDGVLTQNRTDGTSYTVDLDGRYAQTVNGVVPDVNGNIALNIAETQSGTLAARPASANSGVVYIVAGDPDANNDGETYIWDGTTWHQVTPFDTAYNDARYVNLTGDTMTGTLELSGDPTSNLHAATKQYVDGAIVEVTNFTLDATGNLVITESNSDTHWVNLDGRYVVDPGTATTNGQILTWDSATSAWVVSTPAAGGFDNYVASGTFTSNNTVSTLDLVYANTAVANAVVDLSHGITNHTDVDTLTVAPTNNQVLTWNGTNWVPGDTTHVVIADVAPTAPLEGDLWYDSNTNFRTYVWSATASAWLDVAPSAAGGSSIQNIDDLLDVDTTSKVPNESLLAWNGTNWVAVSVLDASDGTIDDF